MRELLIVKEVIAFWRILIQLVAELLRNILGEHLEKHYFQLKIVSYLIIRKISKSHKLS